MSTHHALNLALEALYENTHYTHDGDCLSAKDKRNDETIIAIKEALAQPQQEPKQQRPQNCGTNYCSFIECVMEPTKLQPTTVDLLEYADWLDEAAADIEDWSLYATRKDREKWKRDEMVALYQARAEQIRAKVNP